jgi:hypothetical protein
MIPAANGGSTVLLDDNALAAISIRSGVHVAKGTGIILGPVPDGYKIEFTGRSEEPEYFESNQKKFFAILNVEPGAGVLEMVSQQSQDQNTTLFVPILDDTVTYVDLIAPVKQDIAVRVVKNMGDVDAEVSGLTVGLSTQNAIQAITQSNGTATLRNIRLVHGFPVYLDVSSKQKTETSYTYRYELKNPDASGVFVLNQIAEKSLYHWLKQVKEGLSDQGGMIVGSYDRKSIDGFRSSYLVKARPLTAKFGLEPLNYSILWDGQISENEPIEGDLPRFMAVQISEGITQVNLDREGSETVRSDLIPVSPRVIHVISQ